MQNSLGVDVRLFASRVLLWSALVAQSGWAWGADPKAPTNNATTIHPELVAQTGHRVGPECAVFSRDGRLVATGSQQEEVFLWDALTGQKQRTFRGHEGAVLSLSLSPDNARLVGTFGASREAVVLTQGGRNKATMWDTATGQIAFKLEIDNKDLRGTVFNADGKQILGFADDEAVLWDAKTGRRLSHWIAGRGERIIAAAFETRPRLLTRPRRDQVLLREWDIPARQIRVILGPLAAADRFAGAAPAPAPGGDGDPEPTIPDHPMAALSSDGKHVFTYALKEIPKQFLSDTLATVTLWDVTTRGSRSFQLHKSNTDPGPFAVSPDGKLVLMGFSEAVTLQSDLERACGANVWDDPAGKPIHTFYSPVLPGGDYNFVTAVNFSPDSSRILVAYRDGRVTLYDAKSHQATALLWGQRLGVSALAVGPNPSKLYTGSDRVAEWDLKTGRLERLFATPTLDTDNPHTVLDMAVSPDGRWLVTCGSDYQFLLWDVSTGTVKNRRSTKAAPFDGPYSVVTRVAFSPDSRLMLTGSIDGAAKACLWDVPSLNYEATLFGHENTVAAVAFSPDGKLALTGGGNPDKTAILWDVKTRSQGETVRGHTAGVEAAAFHPKNEAFATLTADLKLFYWDGLKSPRQTVKVQVPVPAGLSWASNLPPLRVAFQPPAGDLLLTASYDVATLWSAESLRQGKASPHRTLRGHHMPIAAATFTADGSLLVTGAGDGLIVWDPSTGQELCRMLNLEQDQWLVTRGDGRFDSGNLEENRGIGWSFPDDPFRPLPPEIFARDFFEPRLLPRLLAGEQFPAAATPPEQLNRVQPEFAVPVVRTTGDLSQITLRIRATNNRDYFGVGQRRREMVTDAYDLRLLRDGQLVWQYPSPDNDPNRDLTIRTDAQLKAWRDAYHLVPTRPDGWYETTVEVRLPHNHRAEKSARFEAYCFNEDRVKSRTAAIDVSLPAGLEPVRPKAYVICLGVNASQTRALDLRFAAADARDVGSRLRSALDAQDYEAVPVTLISDYEGARYSGRVTAQNATKENLRAVLSQLAGEALSPEARKRLPVEARNLPRSGPDDLVVLYAAGHGYTDPADGMFYLLTYDVGDYANALRGDAKAREAAFREIFMRSVSSSELSRWLRGVDAAQHVLVLDTCMSQGAVASAASEFKPGPFGSRGLGQLAYDKAMLVLAASQTDEFAVETDRGGLKHGLLTYTLLEGMKPADPGQPPRAAAGGILTLVGLLQYAADQVPEVFKAAKAGQLEKRGLPVQPRNSAEPWAERTKIEIERRWPSLNGEGGFAAQRPVLFDYRRGRRDVILAEAKPTLQVK